MSVNDTLEKYGIYMGIAVSFLVAYLAIILSIWQLAVVAGIIGGFFCTKTKLGALIGSLGVGLAWLLYVIIKVITSEIVTLFDQVGTVITGAEGFGMILIVVVVVIGFLFGLFGGYLGSSIRVLIDFQRTRTDTTDEKPAEVSTNP